MREAYNNRTFKPNSNVNSIVRCSVRDFTGYKCVVAESCLDYTINDYDVKFQQKKKSTLLFLVVIDNVINNYQCNLIHCVNYDRINKQT